MAKKSQVPPAPEMTALPISQGDSPLVIDLPDGQKLVVGNMAAGSVIEVATWRGTGRPDSRTSRLMLGMSSATATPTENAPAERKKESASVFAKAMASLKTVVGKLAAQKKSAGKKRSSAPFIETVAPAVKNNEAAEVDDWLNSILEKSAKKSAVKSASKKPAAKKSAVKKSAPKKSTTGRKR